MSLSFPFKTKQMKNQSPMFLLNLFEIVLKGADFNSFRGVHMFERCPFHLLSCPFHFLLFSFHSLSIPQSARPISLGRSRRESDWLLFAFQLECTEIYPGNGKTMEVAAFQIAWVSFHFLQFPCISFVQNGIWLNSIWISIENERTSF